MKYKYFIFLIVAQITALYGRSYGGSVLLKLNGLDCSNCISIIHYLQKKDFISHKFICVFQEDFKIDSLLFLEKFSIKKFSEKEIHFSDSIYEFYNNHHESELYILSDNNQILYSSSFKNVDSKLFEFILNSDATINGFIDIKLDKHIIERKPYIYDSYMQKIIFNCWDKEYTYDIISKKTTEIRVNNKSKDICYKLLFRDSADFQKKTIDYLIKKGIFDLDISVAYTCMKNDTIAVCALLVPSIDINGNDTIMEKRRLLAEYNLKIEDFVSHTQFPVLENMNERELYYVKYIFFFKNNEMYFLLHKKQKDSIDIYFLAETISNTNKLKINKTYHFPNNYIKYKLYNNFNQIMCRNNLLSMIYSSQLYNLNSLKTIQIPLNDSFFYGLKYVLNKPNKTYNTVTNKPYSAKIYDATLINGNIYRVLYGFMGEIHILDFEEDIILANRILDCKKTDYHPKFMFNAHYILLSDDEQKKFYLKYIP